MIDMCVIIPTFNRSQSLFNYTLKSLDIQNYKNFICVIWDSSSDSRTYEIIKKNKFSFKIDYTQTYKRGTSTCRNDAIKYVLEFYKDIEHFVFLDDDCILDYNVLYEVNKVFKSMFNVLHINIPNKRKDVNYIDDFLRNTNKYNGTVVTWEFIAVRKEIFDRYNIYFPVLFETYTPCAYMETMAFGYYISKTLNKNLYTLKTCGCLHEPKCYINDKNYLKYLYFNSRLLFNNINKNNGFIKKYINSIRFEYYCFYKNLIYLFKKKKYKTMYEYYLKMYSVRKRANIYKERESIFEYNW